MTAGSAVRLEPFADFRKRFLHGIALAAKGIERFQIVSKRHTEYFMRRIHAEVRVPKIRIAVSWLPHRLKPLAHQVVQDIIDVPD